MLIPILFLAIGLVLLVVGSEMLVRGAVRMALHFGVTPLVIGLTVVAFGTSAPELLVSVTAAFRGQADIALGNVLGSNVFNVLAILGLSALVVPLTVAKGLLRFDVPYMIGTAVLVGALGYDGKLSRVDGLLLVAALVVYLGISLWRARHGAEMPADLEGIDPEEGAKTPLWKNLAFVGVGLVGLGAGSTLFVDGAATIARQLGVSELVIGLTVVAAGTSLPEIATSVMAAFRGERDIAVGNVVGSNIFNVTIVLGSAAAVGTGVVVPEAALNFDIPVMIGISLLVLPIFLTGRVVSRGEGLLLSAYYITYTTWLVLGSLNHPSLATFTQVAIIGVPVAGIAIFALDALFSRNANRAAA